MGTLISTVQCRGSWTNNNMNSIIQLVSLLLMLSTSISFARYTNTNLYDRSCIAHFACDTDFHNVDINVQSAVECRAQCDRHPECNYFTWYSKGFLKHVCTYHTVCANISFNEHCYSGPRSSACPRLRFYN